MFNLRTFILFINIFLLTSSFVNSQTKVKGVITDKNSGNPVPFANVVFKGTSIGIVTDSEGVFFLKTTKNHDVLLFSCIGYESDTLKITRNIYQEVDISLIPKSYSIEEIVIKAGENPAHKMLRNIIKNKKRNNYRKHKSYSYEQYNKMEFDLNNFSEGLKDAKMFKKLQIAFDGVDTSAVNGKVYMPLMISETVSDFYFRKNPRKQKEIIKAVNISGVKNKSVNKFTGQMYSEINFYENYVELFELQLVSPISVAGLMTYEYYLTDSIFIDNQRCYHMTFKPRRKYEFTFKGDMWITDTTYALKSISARISKGVNIDFIKDVYIKQGFSLVEDSIMFPDREELLIDFSVAKFTAGFFGKKTLTRKEIKLNIEYDDDFFSKSEPREVITLDSADKIEQASWNDIRHEELTEKEKNIYTMVDSVKNTRTFRTMRYLGYALATGYLGVGKYFEMGPYYEIYSRNEIEGSRFQIGGRTSNDFSKVLEFRGHTAFGLADQKLKYGIGTKIKFDDTPWTIADISYTSDMVRFGASQGTLSERSVFTSLISRSPNDDIQLVKDLEISIQRDWFKGFYNKLTYSNKIIYPSDSINFINSIDDSIGTLNVSEISLATHFCLNEEFVSSVFSRMSVGSNFPIFDIEISKSIDGGFLKGDYNYTRLKMKYSHRFYLGFLGKFKYRVELGKVFGKVPFPLLQLHEGNETYIYDRYSYNLMNYYEFASDQYLSISFENHFNGFFFNRIPFLRRLKLREVIHAKGVIGSLKTENRDEFAFPGVLSDVTKPYIEAGVAIENILQFLRVDAIWRLTHLDNPNISKFGLRISVQLSF